MAVDLDPNRAAEVAAGLEGSGHISAGVDLRDLDAHASLVGQAVDEFGNIRALAHLAAVLRRVDSVDAVTEADWDMQLDTNLKASFFLCRAVADAMVSAGKGGRIIAFSITAASSVSALAISARILSKTARSACRALLRDLCSA